MSFTTRAAATAAAGLAALAMAAPAEAVRGVSKSQGKPTDYLNVKGLSQPTFSAEEIEKTSVVLKAFDGVDLYLEVTKPKAAGRRPVVLEASPYHGTLADREGTRVFPGPVDEETGQKLGLTGYFARRGYAVVMFDLRGTGRSRGCLDHLGVRDARDLKQVVEWAAAQDWSNGKVGMTGHSYVGSTPMVAAAQRPKGLATIVPSAGLAAMYDHQFQGGVPYYLQWAGPQWTYPALAIGRKVPAATNNPVTGNTGDDGGKNMEDLPCSASNSALVSGEDQLSGRYADWHAQRDWREGAKDADIPVFLFHGVNDQAARITAAQWFFERGGRKGDKAWIGQWNHDSVNHRGAQWTGALHAWFDKHLAGRDVDTGPGLEAFLSGGSFAGGRTGDREEVLTAQSIGEQDAPSLTLSAAPDGKLTAGAPAAGSRTFDGTAQGYTTTTDGLLYTTGPLEQGLVLAGVPEMVLSASVTVPRTSLIATLYEKSPAVGTRRITQCSINPELRTNVAQREVVVPGTRYDMAPPCMAMAHHVKAGSELVLRVSSADADKVPTFASAPRTTVFSGGEKGGTAITLPVVERPALTPDTVELTAEG
jgi:uncharacterized protein